jgi:hypothetical protein
MTEPRIVPLDPPYSAPVADALERIMPAGVPPPALFRTLAMNERVFLRVIAAGLLDRGSITLREREIVIDRTCARYGSEYEWGVHVTFFAERARLSLEEVASTYRARDGRVLPARAAAPPPRRRSSRHGPGLGRTLAGPGHRVDSRAAHRADRPRGLLPPHLIHDQRASHPTRSLWGPLPAR